MPLLIVTRDDGAEAVLFESAVICEYLEESQPGVPLHPADPLTRAQHRGWIEFGSSILSDLWGFETAKDADAYEVKRKALIEKFDHVEVELGEGPFFAGERFSLVDAVFAPIFRYFDVFDTVTDTGVFAETPKVRAWRATLAARPSVMDAVTDDYPARLRDFERFNPDSVPPGAWFLVLASGVVQYALAFWLYLIGLRVFSIGAAGLFLTLIPVFGAGGAVLFLGERLSPNELAGCGIVIAAVLAGARRAERV